MADFEDNPFADPGDSNPFQDPSVQQATTGNSTSKGLEEFNPFEDSNTQNTGARTTPITSPPRPADTQPAVMRPTSDAPPRPPPPYTQSAAQPAMTQAQEDLMKRQEELEKKAAELQRREQQMRSAQYNTRQNNWPPLPSWFPLQPCFYQDFSVDIPLEFQKVVKIGYYLWMAYSIVMLLNFIVSLAYFSSGGSSAGTTFGLSILFFILFVPCSFICWYRPVYKAFRSDSSFNFFMFFFVFFIQLLVTIVQAIGIDQWGTVGFINGLSHVASGSVGKKAVGGMMLIMGFLWAVLAVVDTIFLKQVHSLYRTTGANFQKAQEEFARGVVSNPGVQTATKSAASGAISGAFTTPQQNQM
ncbi:LOW QUALITY PROTEIN: secretory carrier-associated membrane protein 1-like [Amphiura filiformis]|uniref:LOW QUALITY PROTEIN: secretory carrier-associated membrane protein 1-like n=1 Tax=Amphiura filiformis TaxID=82378 RepID=UPI003B2154E9